jgi:ankyrin repeat protein
MLVLLSLKKMLGYYVLLLSVVSLSSFTVAMEQALDCTHATVRLRDIPYTLPLQKALSHICGYQKTLHPKTRKSDISGFHWYSQPPAHRVIMLHEGRTLCKISPDLWVVALGDISRFHRGYVIYKGEVIEKPKTFFPATWKRDSILTYIATLLQQGSFSLVDERNYDSYKEFALKITQPQEPVPFYMVISGCPEIPKSMHIVTLFPALNTQLSSLVNLKAFALQQIEEKKALKVSVQTTITPMPELIKALAEDQLVAALDLLSSGADPNIVSENNIVPLMVAARRGNWEAVSFLVEYGALKTSVDSQGNTPLHWAVRSGDYATALGLITEELANKPNNAKETPLMLALAGRHIDIVKLLLEFKADVRAHDPYGRTPLMQVIASIVRTKEDTICDKALAEILLEYGADIDEKDAHGATALVNAILLNRKPLVELLLKHNADYECTYKKENLSILAQRRNFLDIVDCLEHHVNRKYEWLTENAATEFMYAVYTNNMRKVQTLIAHANVNEQNMYQQTPLFFAVENNNPTMVRILLQAGADPCVLTPGGISIYQYAQDKKCSPELLKLLDIEVKRQLEAAKRQEEKKQQERRGVDELIYKALESDTLSGVPVSIIHEYKNKPLNRLKDTLLLCAVRKQKYQVVSQLLAYNADVEAQNSASEDILDIAYHAGDIKMLLLLIQSEKCKWLAIERCLVKALKTENNAIVEAIVQALPSIVFDTFYRLLHEHESALCLTLLRMYPRKITAHQVGNLCIEAVRQREQAILKELYVHHPSVITYINERNESPLRVAVVENNIEAARFLCDCDADIKDEEHEGYRAVEYARGDILQLLVTRKSERLLAQQKRQEQQEKEKREQELKNKGYSSLMVAVYQRNRQVVQVNKDPSDSIDKEGQTAYMLAAQLGYDEIMTELLSKEDSVHALNKVDNQGRTALLWALENRHFALIKPLLEKGARIIGVSDKNILSVVAASKAPKIIRKLIKDSIVREILDYCGGLLGQTTSAVNKRFYKEYFCTLSTKRKKACINSYLACNSRAGASILFAWIGNESEGTEICASILDESIKQANYLGIAFALGSRPDIVTYHHVMSALEKNNPAAMSLLFSQAQSKLSLAQAAHVCIQSLNQGHVEIALGIIKYHKTPLLEVCIKQEGTLIPLFSYLCQVASKEFIECILILKLIDINYASDTGTTPLMHACRVGRNDIAMILLQHGADLSKTNRTGVTALFIALGAKNKIMIPMLYERGCRLRTCVPPTMNMLGFPELHTHILDLLSGIQLDSADALQLMEWACKAAVPEEVIRWLLRNYDINLNTLKLDNGWTPLHAAVQRRLSSDIVQLFLARGVPVNAQDMRGTTALAWACASNLQAIVSVLLQAGADPNVRLSSSNTTSSDEWILIAPSNNKDQVIVCNGDTPLLIACAQGNEAIVRLLLETNKVDLTVRNAHGDDAFDTVKKGSLNSSLLSGRALLNTDMQFMSLLNTATDKQLVYEQIEVLLKEYAAKHKTPGHS